MISDTYHNKLYCMCIKFCGLIFRVFDWQENLWGINFCDHGGMVGTIIVRFAKYTSYCGLILWIRGIPQNPLKFIHHKNFYAYGITIVTYCFMVFSRVQYHCFLKMS